MAEERLLERLTKGYDLSAPLGASRGRTDARLIASVTEHLRRIFNTRRGTVLTDPEYGLPDFSELPGDFASPETDALGETIRGLAEKYEPRLTDVTITFEGASQDELSLCFSLSGTIVHEEERIPLHLLTRMVSDGKFEI